MFWEKSPKFGRKIEIISEETCVFVASRTECTQRERKKGEEDSNVNQISALHANSNN